VSRLQYLSRPPQTDNTPRRGHEAPETGEAGRVVQPDARTEAAEGELRAGVSMSSSDDASGSVDRDVERRPPLGAEQPVDATRQIEAAGSGGTLTPSTSGERTSDDSRVVSPTRVDQDARSTHSEVQPSTSPDEPSPEADGRHGLDDEPANSERLPTAADQTPATVSDLSLEAGSTDETISEVDDEPVPPDVAPSSRPERESDRPATVEPAEHRAEVDDSLATQFEHLAAEQDKGWVPGKAGLPPCALPEAAQAMSTEEIEAMAPEDRRAIEYEGAAEYIAKHREQRPWLDSVIDASPAVQRIFASIDQGNGHAHVRHGPMGDDRDHANRVAFLEDPAQTVAEKRSRSVDGLDASKTHYCGPSASRIHDAAAFAAAFSKAIDHPLVKQSLDSPWNDNYKPPDVRVPISELLGPDGHLACSGYVLSGWPGSKKERKQWVDARANGRDLSDLPEPRAERIPTFEEGFITISFARDRPGRRYEVMTMYPLPKKL
jgi:hypothetical protein